MCSASELIATAYVSVNSPFFNQPHVRVCTANTVVFTHNYSILCCESVSQDMCYFCYVQFLCTFYHCLYQTTPTNVDNV